MEQKRLRTPVLELPKVGKLCEKYNILRKGYLWGRL